jgi:hypothetical protein
MITELFPFLILRILVDHDLTIQSKRHWISMRRKIKYAKGKNILENFSRKMKKRMKISEKYFYRSKISNNPFAIPGRVIKKDHIFFIACLSTTG